MTPFSLKSLISLGPYPKRCRVSSVFSPSLGGRVESDQSVKVAHLRIIEHLIEGPQRRAGDILFFEQFQPMVPRAVFKNFLQDLSNKVVVLHPTFTILKARILPEIGKSNYFCEAGPELLRVRKMNYKSQPIARYKGINLSLVKATHHSRNFSCS